MSPNTMIHVGFGNVVRNGLIKCVLPPTSANSKRLLKAAKTSGGFQDLTCGHPTKCLILLRDGTVISCALTGKTIVSRIQNEQEAEDEDH